MSFSVPASLEAELDELTTHYPVQRSASLMFLHALQEHFGYISKDSVGMRIRFCHSKASIHQEKKVHFHLRRNRH